MITITYLHTCPSPLSQLSLNYFWQSFCLFEYVWLAEYIDESHYRIPGLLELILKCINVNRETERFVSV